MSNSPWGARLAGLTLLLTMATMVAGCGSSSDPIASKTPEQILLASRAAAARASAVKITNRASQGPLKLASTMLMGNGVSRTSLSFAGVSNETIRIGGTVYARGNPRFYRRLLRGTGAAVPPGTWIKESAANGGKSPKRDTRPEVRRQIETLLADPGNLTKGSATTVAGQKAIAISSSSPRGTTTIYIAATGDPYPIEIVRHGREDGKTAFSEWNRPVSANPPAHATELAALRARVALGSSTR